MLSLHPQGRLLLAAVRLPIQQERRKGLRPIFLGPCTLRRTWGTRPGNRVWFFATTAAPKMNSEQRAMRK
jgi:hypothetical protein